MAAENRNINAVNQYLDIVEDAENEDTVDVYALMVRLIEKWYLVAVLALIGAVAMAVTSICFITPQYKATAKIYVTNNKDSALNLSDLQISTYLTNDYQEVFKVWEVHELVRQKLGLDYTYKQMAKMISVANPANTRILEITVNSPDAVEAMQMANTYAQVSREYIATKMDTAMPTVLEQALAPTTPASPKTLRNTAAGFFGGALLALAIIIINFLRDDYIRTADDIERWVHIPVLGTVMKQTEIEFAEQNSAYRKGRRKKV